MTELTFEVANELLRYDPETGGLFWRWRDMKWFKDGRAQTSWNTRYADKAAFTALEGGGYMVGRVLGWKYSAHRIIWLLHTGGWPADQIDHVNGIRVDNRISNLRDVSASGNSQNHQRRLDNTSGQTGVSWAKHKKKWQALINASGKQLHLGYFKDMHDAIMARTQAERANGYHPNHGRT